MVFRVRVYTLHSMAAVAILVSCCGVLQASEYSRVELRESFDRLADDPARLRKLLGIRGDVFSEEHKNILISYYQRVLRISEFSDKIYDLVYPISKASKDSSIDYFDFGAAVGASLSVKGLRRLTVDRQEQFLKYAQGMMKWLKDRSPETCKAMMVSPSQKASVNQAFEMAYMADLPGPRVRAIFDLYYEALVAELTDFPAIRSVTSEQARFGSEAFEAALTDRFLKEVDAQSLADAAEDLEGAPPEQVCAFAILSIDALLGMESPVRDWAFQSFFDSLQ